MTQSIISEVLEATGYLDHGGPAHGVSILDIESDGYSGFRDFSPDALWRSESPLTVYFKYQHEGTSEEQISSWQREVWNQGFAPLLWVISPDKIDVYNGFGRPREAGNATAHLLDTFGRIETELDRLNTFAGRLAMETGQFWHHTQIQEVHRKTCVDQQLLSDLGALERDLLQADLDRPSAQGLIGRSIFTQYLTDRGIVTRQLLESECSHGSLSSILRDRQATERLFYWLRDTFNGDMFPAEASLLPEEKHLCRVADFLDAMDPESGQASLFPYQFDVIPVELISSIYEQFVHTATTLNSEGDGQDVHYTRLSLVSLILDEIMDGLEGQETVLDLSCGSGVFLVEAFRRLVKHRCRSGNPSREVIRSILYDQIYGVDISEAATRVAAFSLYLTALELDSCPSPPEALKFKPLIGKTLIIADSMEVEDMPEGKKVLTEGGDLKKFDVIVGNPPWSFPGRRARADSDRGQMRSPRGLSLDFVSRALDFASDNSRIGMVVSGVQFFPHSNTGVDMVQDLLKKLSPVTLVNLSYQTDWLFPGGNLPAMILLAGHQDSERDTITAVQVPWSPAGKRSHIFEIACEDITTLSMSHWLHKPELLKTAFFGRDRDFGLLDSLTERYKPLEEHLEALGTKLRSGLILGKQSNDSRFLHGLLFVSKARDLKPFAVSENLNMFESDYAERPRSRDVYRAPLLLVRESLQADGRVACAVAERDMVFVSTFRGATIPQEKTDAAHLIASILSSSLASWFFLMTGSTFGLFKTRLLLRDMEKMPVPALESACHSAAGRKLVKIAQKNGRNQTTNIDWQEIDEAVFDLYELDDADRIVARDGLTCAGWHWKSGRLASVEPADTDTDLLAYSDAFLSVVNAWLAVGNRCRMSCEIFEFSKKIAYRVIRFFIEDGASKPEIRVIKPEGNLQDTLDRIGDRLQVSIGKFLIGQHTLRVYGPDEVIIIKPAAKRHWMCISALNDADAVVSDSLTGRLAA